MATITITINDDHSQRVLEAFGATTKADVKKKLLEIIKDRVVLCERVKAEEQYREQMMGITIDTTDLIS